MVLTVVLTMMLFYHAVDHHSVHPSLWMMLMLIHTFNMHAHTINTNTQATCTHSQHIHTFNTHIHTGGFVDEVLRPALLAAVGPASDAATSARVALDSLKHVEQEVCVFLWVCVFCEGGGDVCFVVLVVMCVFCEGGGVSYMCVYIQYTLLLPAPPPSSSSPPPSSSSPPLSSS